MRSLSPSAVVAAAAVLICLRGPSGAASSDSDSFLRMPQELAVGAVSNPGKETSPNVKVGFYSESLCPFCRQFMEKTLAPMFENGISSIMDLEFVPSGNTRTDPATGAIECQHGQLECDLNEVFACALNSYPDQDKWFPFIHCVESKDPETMKESLAECADEAGIDLSPVTDCYTGSLGDELQQQLKEKTDALHPAHQWVPWLTVNGVPIWEDMDKLPLYICASYGGGKPAVCYDKMALDSDDELPLSDTAPCVNRWGL